MPICTVNNRPASLIIPPDKENYSAVFSKFIMLYSALSPLGPSPSIAQRCIQIRRVCVQPASLDYFALICAIS